MFVLVGKRRERKRAVEESGTVQLMMMPYFGSSLFAFLRLLLFPLLFLPHSLDIFLSLSIDQNNSIFSVLLLLSMNHQKYGRTSFFLSILVYTNAYYHPSSVPVVFLRILSLLQYRPFARRRISATGGKGREEEKKNLLEGSLTDPDMMYTLLIGKSKC